MGMCGRVLLLMRRNKRYRIIPRIGYTHTHARVYNNIVQTPWWRRRVIGREGERGYGGGDGGGIGGDIADTRVHNVRATAAYTYVKITVEEAKATADGRKAYIIRVVRGRGRPPAHAGHRYYMSGTLRWNETASAAAAGRGTRGTGVGEREWEIGIDSLASPPSPTRVTPPPHLKPRPTSRRRTNNPEG